MTTTARHRATGVQVQASRSRAGRVLGLMSTLGAVLLSMIAVLAVVISVATHLSARGQYTAFGHPVLTVLSGSMTPVIRTGDLIVDDAITPAKARQLRVGQIASFRAAAGSPVIITHRIVARRVVRGVVEYQTKGDANNAPDIDLRPASDVVGVFATSIRAGGYVLSALHRPIVPGLLVASAALWFLAVPLYRLARDMDKRQPQHTRPGGTKPDAIISQKTARHRRSDGDGSRSGGDAYRWLHLRPVQRDREQRV